MYHEKKSAPVFMERPWRSSDGWMARTGCDFAAAISAYDTALTRRARQVLPAYGLQAFPRTEYPNPQKLFLPTIHGGHFYMAENRTFLFCVDSASRGRGGV